jgi:thiol:disulfide interchange protein
MCKEVAFNPSSSEDPLFIMNARIIASILLLGALPLMGAESTAKSTRPDIYDEGADGAKQISEALKVAKKDNKRVLLQFGANWCGWCHKLHKLFESDPEIAATLKDSYVVVLVDVNKGHNQETDKKYDHPTVHGLPVIVILDSDGKPLVTQDTGKLEEGDHHDPHKVLSFLQQWAGKKV